MTDETPKPTNKGGRPKRDRTRPADEYRQSRSRWTTREIEPAEIYSKAGIVIEQGLTPQERGLRRMEALVPEAVARIEALMRSSHGPTALAAAKVLLARGLPKAPTVAIQVNNHGGLIEVAERASRHLKAEDVSFTDAEPADEPGDDETENNA